MILFLHAAAVSLAATQEALERRRLAAPVRHALVPGLVDPRAMAFAEDERDDARIQRALASHLRGDETRAILSCSVYNGFAQRLARTFGIAVERSDDAGARAVLERGRRIGLAVSYPPSYAVVERHLLALAEAAGFAVEIRPLLAENAFAYADDAERYARALVDATRDAHGLDAVFLAQYSMDPPAPRVGEALAIPVVSALESTPSATSANSRRAGSLRRPWNTYDAYARSAARSRSKRRLSSSISRWPSRISRSARGSRACAKFRWRSDSRPQLDARRTWVGAEGDAR